MNKKPIFDYIFHTPYNINPAILEQIMDSVYDVHSGPDYVKGLGIRKLDNFLYEATYDQYDYDAAAEYVEQFKPTLGGCSSFRKGDFVGRNYDWNYDKSVEFVVRTPHKFGRHGSIGIANTPSAITEALIESGAYDKAYEVVPYMTLDGINDAHVMCNLNIVPAGDMGRTTGTNPNGKTMSIIGLPRFVLDNADSAADAVAKISQLNVVALFGKMNLEGHLMIADMDATYVVEFVNNTMNVISDQNDNFEDFNFDIPMMTNSYLSQWKGDLSTAAFTYHDEEFDPETTSLTLHAEGLERLGIIKDTYNSLTGPRSVMQLLNDIKFTNAYNEDDFWYTEMNGNDTPFGDLTIYSPKEDFAGIKDYVIEDYKHRSRDRGTTWQTVHSSVYDLRRLELRFCTQEDYSKEYVLSLNTLSDDIIIYDGGGVEGY